MNYNFALFFYPNFRGSFSSVAKGSICPFFPLDSKGERVGVPIKSSSLGKKTGYAEIERLCGKHKTSTAYADNIATLQERIRQAMAECSFGSKEEGLAALNERLNKSHIQMVLRENKEGRIYGITFIDHQHRMIYNGSKLGKEFSANELAKSLTKPQTPIFTPQQQTAESRTNDVWEGNYSSTPADRHYANGRDDRYPNTPPIGHDADFWEYEDEADDQGARIPVYHHHLQRQDYSPSDVISFGGGSLLDTIAHQPDEPTTDYNINKRKKKRKLKL